VERLNQVPHVGFAGDILRVVSGKFVCFRHR